MSPRGRIEATPAEAKDWFDKIRSGASVASIAKMAGRDPRTVKRAVNFYAAGLEMREVRRDSLRTALEAHYQDLLGVLKKARERAASRAVPSFDRIPTLRAKPGELMPYGFKVDWEGQRPSARYSAEGTPLWTMLQSHLGRDPVWVRFRNWREAGENLAGEMLLTYLALVNSLKKTTGLDLAKVDEPGLVIAGTRHLFEIVVAETAGSSGAVIRLLRSLTAEPAGVRADRTWLLIQVERDAEAMVQAVREAVGSPEFRDRMKSLTAAISKCRESGASFAEDLAYTTAVRHLGGECRGCARIAL